MKTEILMAERQQVEQALGESEQRYRRLLAATTDYIYTVAVENGRSGATSHGPGCAAVTGYTSAEFASDPFLWYRVVHEEDREAVVAQARRILAGDTPPPLEHRLMPKQGGVRWVRNTPIPHRNALGQLVAYDGLISDITSRKRAEFLLAAEYAVTRDLVVANSLAGIMPMALEHLCQTLFWHHAAHWQCEDDQLRRTHACWRAPLRPTDPEATGAPRVLGIGAGLPGRVLAKGEAVWVSDVAIEPELLPDAPPAGAGLHCGCAFPIRFNHHLAGVIELYSREVQELDERMLEVLSAIGIHLGQFMESKRAEARMRRTDRLLRRSQAIAHVGSWELDSPSRHFTWSTEVYRILGLKPQPSGVSYDAFLECVHPDDRAALDTAYAESVRDGRDTTFETEHRVIRRSTGEVRFVREKCKHVRDASGKVVRSVGMVQDITEQKEAARQLEEAFSRLARRDLILKDVVRKLKTSHTELKEAQLQLIQAAKLESVGTLAAGVAHEVKNPLQTILLGLHYLAGKFSDQPEDVTLTLADMRDAVVRANGIIRELLSLAADTRFEPQPGDVNAVIERSLWLMHNELLAAKVEVVRALSPDLPPVLMDASKLEQVFINFFLNAIQAMPKGGQLRVTTRPARLDGDASVRGPLFHRFNAGDHLVITEVEDTGPGIAEADLPRVFDPFFTTKPVGVGTGLGLSVARKIVDLHAGAVEIRNVPAGGARVTVVLKACKRGGA